MLVCVCVFPVWSLHALDWRRFISDYGATFQETFANIFMLAPFNYIHSHSSTASGICEICMRSTPEKCATIHCARVKAGVNLASQKKLLPELLLAAESILWQIQTTIAEPCICTCVTSISYIIQIEHTRKGV